MSLYIFLVRRIRKNIHWTENLTRAPPTPSSLGFSHSRNKVSFVYFSVRTLHNPPNVAGLKRKDSYPSSRVPTLLRTIIMPVCCYVNCNAKCTLLEMFRFPTPKYQLDRCLKWLECIGRPDLNTSNLGYRRFVCSKHFIGGRPNGKFPNPIPYNQTVLLIETQPPATNNTTSPELVRILEATEESLNNSMYHNNAFATYQNQVNYNDIQNNQFIDSPILTFDQNTETETIMFSNNHTNLLFSDDQNVETVSPLLTVQQNIETEQLPMQNENTKTVEEDISLQTLLTFMNSKFNWSYGKHVNCDGVPFIKVFKSDFKNGQICAIALIVDSAMKPSFEITSIGWTRSLNLEHNLSRVLPSAITSISVFDKCLNEINEWQVCEGTTEADLVLIHQDRSMPNESNKCLVARATNCELAVKHRRCIHCVKLRNTLKRYAAQQSKMRQKRTELTQIQKLQLRDFKREVKRLERSVKQIANKTKRKAAGGLGSIVTNLNGTFAKIFKENQAQNLKIAIPANRRFHPLVVKWSLHLYKKSPAAYRMLQDTGIVILPSKRSLQRYMVESVNDTSNQDNITNNEEETSSCMFAY